MGGSLLVIGPGVLGGLVGRLYKQTHPEAKVVGQTNTETNHGRSIAVCCPSLMLDSQHRLESRIPGGALQA